MQQEKIVYATEQMIPSLTKLWMEAFGDDREYVDFYFKHRFTEDNLLVYLIAGEPVSMISMLPVMLHEDKSVDARYIYAVATQKEHRRRGYAKALIEEGYRRLGVPFILEPADEGLAAYYQKMGFRDAFYIVETVWTRAQIEKKLAQYKAMQEKMAAEDIVKQGKESEQTAFAGMTVSAAKQPQQYWLLTTTPREYKQLRDKLLGSEAGYAKWDEEAISYALLENDYCGGYTYKVFHHDREDILMYRMESAMDIIETSLSEQDILGVLDKLRMIPEQLSWRRRVDKSADAQNPCGKIRRIGMIYGDIDIKNGYLNLTLE